MATKGLSTATCSKCGIRHVRPVAVRCKRTLNSSALSIRNNHSSDEESQAGDIQITSQSDVEDVVPVPAPSGASGTAPHLAQQSLN